MLARSTEHNELLTPRLLHQPLEPQQYGLPQHRQQVITESRLTTQGAQGAHAKLARSPLADRAGCVMGSVAAATVCEHDLRSLNAVRQQ